MSMMEKFVHYFSHIHTISNKSKHIYVKYMLTKKHILNCPHA